jgi:hypothetical protein
LISASNYNLQAPPFTFGFVVMAQIIALFVTHTSCLPKRQFLMSHTIALGG